MTRAIDKVPHCTSMAEVRPGVNALDDVLVPLLVQRSGYMTQAARVKKDEALVRDEERIETIVHARAHPGPGGGRQPRPDRGHLPQP